MAMRAKSLPLSSVVTFGVGGSFGIAALCGAVAAWAVETTRFGGEDVATRATAVGVALLGVLVAAGVPIVAWARRKLVLPLQALAASVETGERIDSAEPASAIPEIAALRAALARSRDSALRDALTQAYNRRFLAEVLPKLAHQSERARTPLSALMIDVDRFKKLNDRHGHAAGDRVLAAVAQRLAEQIRMSDTLVRYGGEEFLVLLPNTALPGALAIAERVREAVAAARTAVPRTEQPLAVTVSVGVAALPDHGAGGEDLVLAADQALFRAKAAGRNRVFAAVAQGEPAKRLALVAGS
jgi:diguanylate cyclase (GGDEF)-like protein